MRIRTVTTGITLDPSIDTEVIQRAADFNKAARKMFEEEGYEVQTTRVSTNPWEEYVQESAPEEIVGSFKKIDGMCEEMGIDFFSNGYTSTPENITVLPNIIKNTRRISTSAKIGDAETGMDIKNIYASARTIIRNSMESPDGLGNFLFCAWANCPPGTPFFPASYHEGDEPSFALGLESGDLVMKAFTQAGSLENASKELEKVMVENLAPLINISYKLSKEHGIPFKGIDVSPAPSLEPEGSVAFAFEKLGLGKFGQSGTLTIAEMVTRTLKALPIETCGYSGLMLPVCEDLGLCEGTDFGRYNIQNLLVYSTVCGCGLDTVPIPGDVTVERLKGLLMDLAALAIRLNKPLSARLLPVQGREAGDITSFNSQYLAECRIFDI